MIQVFLDTPPNSSKEVRHTMKNTVFFSICPMEGFGHRANCLTPRSATTTQVWKARQDAGKIHIFKPHPNGGWPRNVLAEDIL